MRKVTKPMAKRLYNEGMMIYLVPCKCPPDKKDGIQLIGEPEGAASFESMLVRFENYKCNKESGKYTHFYIEA